MLCTNNSISSSGLTVLIVWHTPANLYVAVPKGAHTIVSHSPQHYVLLCSVLGLPHASALSTLRGGCWLMSVLALHWGWVQLDGVSVVRCGDCTSSSFICHCHSLISLQHFAWTLTVSKKIINMSKFDT